MPDGYLLGAAGRKGLRLVTREPRRHRGQLGLRRPADHHWPPVENFVIYSYDVFTDIDNRLCNGWAVVVSTIGDSDRKKMFDDCLVCGH